MSPLTETVPCRFGRVAVLIAQSSLGLIPPCQEEAGRAAMNARMGQAVQASEKSAGRAKMNVQMTIVPTTPATLSVPNSPPGGARRSTTAPGARRCPPRIGPREFHPEIGGEAEVGERLRDLRQNQLRVGGETYLQAEERGDGPEADDDAFGAGQAQVHG